MKYIFSLLLICALLLVSSTLITAQVDSSFIPGLVKDTSEDKLVLPQSGIRTSIRKIPSMVNLRNFARDPLPLNQVSLEICGVFALAAAQTIENWIFEGYTTPPVDPLKLREEIELKRGNPQQLKTIFQVAQEMGLVTDASRLFGLDDKYNREQKVYAIQLALTEHHPVLIRISGSPAEPKNKSKVITQLYNSPHAMVLVGYQNGNFIALNSLGSGWGDGGFCLMPYRFADNVWDGVIFSSRQKGENPTVESVETSFSDSFSLSHKDILGDFKELQPRWDSLQRAYVYQDTLWQISRDLFQMKLNIKNDACYYLVSISKGKTSLEKKYIYEPEATLTWPPIDGAPMSDEEEVLVLLCAKTPIPEIKEKLSALHFTKGKVMECLASSFGETLTDTNGIYDPKQPGFNANVYFNQSEYIVPVIFILKTSVL